MKDIASVTGRLAQDLTGSSETGPRLGETGYLEKPQRSYALDREPSEKPSVPAPREASLPSVRSTTTPFQPFSPMPDSKPTVIITRGGRPRTALALSNPSDLSQVQAEIERLEMELEEVDPLEVAALLRRLLGHYSGQMPKDPKVLENLAEDWIYDMRGMSRKAFVAAIETWRQSDHPFKPTPGQILTIIKSLERPLRERLAQCFDLEWIATKTTPEKPKQIEA